MPNKSGYLPMPDQSKADGRTGEARAQKSICSIINRRFARFPLNLDTKFFPQDAGNIGKEGFLQGAALDVFISRHLNRPSRSPTFTLWQISTHIFIFAHTNLVSRQSAFDLKQQQRRHPK